jgi:hypothetical protein
MENIEPGRQYAVRPLKVKNTGEQDIRIEIEAIKPQDNELKDGYSRIPDVGWITLEKDDFVIEPDSWAQTNVLIKVPKDKRYYGKKYQAYILTKTKSRGRIQAGLKSRILFSVKKKKGGIRSLFRWIW